MQKCGFGIADEEPFERFFGEVFRHHCGVQTLNEGENASVNHALNFPFREEKSDTFGATDTFSWVSAHQQDCQFIAMPTELWMCTAVPTCVHQGFL